MADVINHMYFNHFYNESEGYSRTVQMTCFIAFLPTYYLAFPDPSLPPIMVVEGEGGAA